MLTDWIVNYPPPPEQCLNTVRSQNTNRTLTVTDLSLSGKVNTEETEVKEGTENNSLRNEGARFCRLLNHTTMALQ